MQYKVEVSDLANRQYDNFLNYIYNVLMNPQAAVNCLCLLEYNKLSSLFVLAYFAPAFKAHKGHFAVLYGIIQTNKKAANLGCFFVLKSILKRWF